MMRRVGRLLQRHLQQGAERGRKAGSRVLAGRCSTSSRVVEPDCLGLTPARVRRQFQCAVRRQGRAAGPALQWRPAAYADRRRGANRGPFFRPQDQTSQVFQFAESLTGRRVPTTTSSASSGVATSSTMSICARSTGSELQRRALHEHRLRRFLLGLVTQQGLTLYHEANLYSDGGRSTARTRGVRSDLTINYGMRYESFTPMQDRNNLLTNVDPATGQVMTAKSSGSLFDRTLIQPDRNDIAPRVGLRIRSRRGSSCEAATASSTSRPIGTAAKASSRSPAAAGRRVPDGEFRRAGTGDPAPQRLHADLRLHDRSHDGAVAHPGSESADADRAPVQRRPRDPPDDNTIASVEYVGNIRATAASCAISTRV